MPIVENAFKHGASGILEEPEIRLELKIQDHHLFFEAFNKKSSVPQQDETNYKKGIGVSNIKRQLALIYADYSLDVKEGEQDYHLRLSINLNSINQKSKKGARANADAKPADPFLVLRIS